MNLAAIDIGSNAVRLLVSEVVPYRGGVDFTKLSLVRMPLRLGLDVFDFGLIGAEKELALVKSMQAFKLLIEVYEVSKFRACATSAMREAKNRQEIVKVVEQASGIHIDIISGKEEAAIIYDTHMMESGLEDQSRLYIDVGGGSTELTLYSKGLQIMQDSFNIGTIRLLQGNVEPLIWEKMKTAVKTAVGDIKSLEVIGSGGNINKLFSISKNKDGDWLMAKQMEDYLKAMELMSVWERMHNFNLRQERAEVIVPALQIYTSILKWVDASKICVPRIGLADGLIRELYCQ